MVVCAYFPLLWGGEEIDFVHKAFQIHYDRVFFICVVSLVSWIGKEEQLLEKGLNSFTVEFCLC